MQITTWGPAHLHVTPAFYSHMYENESGRCLFVSTKRLVELKVHGNETPSLSPQWCDSASLFLLYNFNNLPQLIINCFTGHMVLIEGNHRLAYFSKVLQCPWFPVSVCVEDGTRPPVSELPGAVYVGDIPKQWTQQEHAMPYWKVKSLWYDHLKRVLRDVYELDVLELKCQ